MNFSIINILLIAISLSVDSFSIALAIGAFFSTITKKEATKLVLSFMLLHFIMLLLGWCVGENIVDYVDVFAHWLILGFLGFVGGKLIYEAIKGEEEIEIKSDFFGYKNILFLSFVTSLDALAIGFSFALLNISILLPNIIISVVVGIMTILGLLTGGKLSEKFPDRMKIVAGIVLILIGLYQLLEHYLDI
jgi:putative Mn2+ efflux pump MntP